MEPAVSSTTHSCQGIRLGSLVHLCTVSYGTSIRGYPIICVMYAQLEEIDRDATGLGM